MRSCDRVQLPRSRSSTSLTRSDARNRCGPPGDRELDRWGDPAFIDARLQSFSITWQRYQLHLWSAPFRDGDDLTTFGTIEILRQVLLELAHADIHVYTLSDFVDTLTETACERAKSGDGPDMRSVALDDYDEHPGQAVARRHRGTLDAAVGSRRHLPLRPHGEPRRGIRDRHAAADGQRLAAHRPRVQLHPHRHHRPLPAHARQERLLPDRVGRQRPGHRAPRAELLRRALRSVAAVRPRLRPAVQRRTCPRTTAPSRSAGRTSSSCATR